MELNKEVILSLELLTEKDKSFFGLFCVKRISGLYELFDDLIEVEKLEPSNKNYTLVKCIIKHLEESLLSDFEIQQSAIDGFIDELNSVPFNDIYGSCDEFMLAANVLASIENVLNFLIKKDERYLARCSDLLINTINIIISSNHHTIDDGISYLEKEHLLAKYHAKEIEIQLAFIKMLRENVSGNDLMAFIGNHLILISNYKNRS